MQKIDQSRLPNHIAIIMDGNGRWAEKNALHRIAGHKAGAEAVKSVVTTARELGIPFLTLYALSVENLLRPVSEVNALMRLLREFLQKEINTLIENDVRLSTIGDINSLPESVRKSLFDAINKTSNLKGMVLTLALSYSGRDDILRAIRLIINDVANGKLKPDDITAQVLSNFLYTANIPDPDLIIRTSGEYRLSNFLIWQSAYTEFYFTNVLWPDFRKDNFLAAIADYQRRERRFGLTSEQLQI